MPLKNNYANNEVLQAADFNAVVTLLNSAEQSANKGQPLGYPSLDAGGKVPVSQLPASLMQYLGVWNAASNTPTLANGTGDVGDVYRVSVGGAANLGAGSITYDLGDYVIYNGTVWEKSDTTDAVATVNTYTGNVVLTKADVGLGNADNTSDATKNAATATLTNKTVNLTNNTLTGTIAEFNTALSNADFATIGGAETLTSKTLTNPTLDGYTEGVLAAGTVGATYTLSIAIDSVITATLTASTPCTFTMPAVGAGKSFTLMLRQAATGMTTATFTGVKWPNGGTAPTMTATASRMDIFTFFSDGTNWYGSAAQNYIP